MEMSIIGFWFVLGFLLYGHEKFATSQELENLTRKLESIMENDLAYSKIQDYFENLSLGSTFLDGKNIVNMLKESIESQLENVSVALINLRNEIERSFDNFNPARDTTNCCDVDLDEYAVRFKSKVNFNEACVTLSSDNNKNASLAPPSVQERMILNLVEFPNLHRQYFGTQQGMWTLYPAQHTCSEYDPRFRPWYVQGASPIPKDVVIVLDTSQSMGNTQIGDLTLLQIAQKAVKTVLKTLNPSDRIGIVEFDDVAHKPHGCGEITCYQNQLALGTSVNIKCLSDYMGRVRAGGNTNYVAAIQEAFNYFHHDQLSLKSRNQVILFVSDGSSQSIASNNKILETIGKNNNELGNTVTILTFGIGENIHKKSSDLLRDMAEQRQTNSSFGTIRKGKYVQVNKVTGLETTLANYYEIFTSFSEDIVFSAPYYDIFSSGTMITASIPFFNRQTLKGVVGVDIILDYLMKDIYSYNSRTSYGFVIDNQGRTVTHPLMPAPSKDNQAIVVNISSLEHGTKQSQMIKNMISGNSGKMPTISKYSVPRGSVLREGVKTEAVRAMYYWRKIRYSKMSVCLVLFKEYIPRMAFSPSKQFIYSRFDLKKPPSTCKFYGKMATIASSVVAFSPKAFEDELRYMERDVDEIDLAEWKSYAKGKDIKLHKKLKDGVRETISGTEVVDRLWPQVPSSPGVWRSIATTNGVFRSIPGVTTSKEFDHTVRPWFIRALAYPRKLILTTPFIDKWSGKPVVTLSKTLHTNAVTGRDPIAVLSTDFLPSYFHSMVQESRPECNKTNIKCYVVNTSGYIVMSDEFINLSCGEFGPANQQYVHIIDKEPGIARTLIEENVMFRESCINIKDIKLQKYWRLGISTTSNRYELHSFRILDIPRTNLLLIERNMDVKSVGNCWCDAASNNPRCQSHSPPHCECPCYTEVDFDFCRNNLKTNDSSDNFAICNPQPLDNSFVEPRDNVTGLKDCYKVVCRSINDQQKCLQHLECSWCSNGTGKDYCSKDNCNACPVIETVPSSNYIDPNRKMYVILGCICFILFLLIGIFVAAKCLNFKVKKKRTNPPSQGELNDGFENSIISGSHMYEVPNVTSSSVYYASSSDSTLKSYPLDSDRRTSVSSPHRRQSATSSVISIPRPPATLPPNQSWRERPRNRASIDNGSVISVPSSIHSLRADRLEHPHISRDPEVSSDVVSSVSAYQGLRRPPYREGFVSYNPQGATQCYPNYLPPIMDAHEPDARHRGSTGWSENSATRNSPPRYPFIDSFHSAISSPQYNSTGSSPFVYPCTPPPRYDERYFQFDC